MKKSVIMKNSAHEEIAAHRIVPVVRLDSMESAEPLAAALVDGGLPVAEITLRSSCAIDAIRLLSKKAGFLVGAGTVLNLEQCETALEAGAQFIVSPGLDVDVIDLCSELEIPCYPGVATATEIQQSIQLGLETLKFFPAEVIGGVSALKAYSGPFHEMKFIPTGGVNSQNVAGYLELDSVLAVGGSWMVAPSLIENGDFSGVVETTAAAVQLVQDLDRGKAK